ncbi:MAG: UDP-N-acetylglucosamine--N-acetylmuramyl-(pentapeptide) pyrophosphoryl-undecaprenol N-acetylglucosamine transferase [Candidatus Omnitrophica bacterium]|nr:UDP-N-acetylglucosamine--N-acetylmuramyl-(pentapeptide) pyrophosphoryl-undecaprenol N-acetylglucosamine transferase [Candidatus Omnitrophota bacterium]
MVAEGSGGHLIPALEVARGLRRGGASVRVVYARRARVGGLLEEIVLEAEADGVQLHPIDVSRVSHRAIRLFGRLAQAGRAWRLARTLFCASPPQVVVGFGGWVSAPVVLAARRAGIPVLLHEQNVRLGRANRFLRRWAQMIAVSFEQSRQECRGTPVVVSGLPIRRAIGTAAREEAAAHLGLDPDALTVLILGGSQGARALNQLACGLVNELTDRERASWQFMHLAGVSDHAAVQAAYAAARARGWVAAHLGRMDWAYAVADVVIARAGASTIAELARCGLPALLVPYPYANGHQRENARVVASTGAGAWLEESAASPTRLLQSLRALLTDAGRRVRMGAQMARLSRPDATTQLASAIVQLARVHA